MTTPDDSPEPIDPDYAALFRAEEPRTPEPAEPEPPSPEPAPEPEPATSRAPEVDTGRLFRSQGAVDHDEAVLALSSDHFGRLRTLQRDDQPPARPDPAPVTQRDAEPEHQPDPVPGLAVDVGADSDAANKAGPVSQAPPEPAVVQDPTVTTRRRDGQHRARSISAGAAYLIVIGLTVIVGFVNALLAGGDLGWPTGLALLASSVYVALTIRPADFAVAVIVPPIAFALTALTAGQVFLGSSASSLLNRAVVWFFALAENWPWIIGSTLVAFAIVLVRGRRR